MTRPLHVVFLPAWYAIPYTGSFVKIQAVAVAAYTSCCVGLIFNEQRGVLRIERWRAKQAQGVRELRLLSRRIPKWGTAGRSAWQKRYVRIMKKYIDTHGEPDLVHAHSYIAGFAASAISKNLGIPYVLTEHASGVASGRITRRHLPLISEAYAGASGLIAVSDFLKEAMREFTQSDIAVIPNCYDDSLFSYTPGEPGDSPFTWISVGSLVKEKGYDILLKAFARHAASESALLEIVGSGPLLARTRKLARRLDIDSVVNFRGALSPESIASLHQNANAYVSASRIETFGVALLEAMASGLPVATTPSGGPQSLVGEHSGVVSADHSPENLADAMDTLRQRYSRFDRRAIASRVRQEYLPEVLAQRLLGEYHAAIKYPD